MTTTDPHPDPPPPVSVPDGHYLNLLLTPAEADMIQTYLRGRNQWIEPIAGTQDDLDPIYGIMPPGTAR